MLVHNFKYSFKTLFRNKILIFWTFAFPIILGTFFYLAFSNIENSEKIATINIAIVENNVIKEDEILRNTFNELENPNNKEKLFNIKYTNKEDAENLLEQKEISGFLIFENNTTKVVVKENGIDQTVLKSVVEQITQTTDMVNNLATKQIEKQVMTGNYNVDYEAIYNTVLEKINLDKSNIVDISNKNMSYTMIEFYTLIAMTCLYGGVLGMVAINQNLANMSSNGKRVSVSPISKGKLIFSSLLASYFVQIIGLALLFIYTIIILKVDYGNNLPLIVLLSLCGSLAGLALGIAIGTILKTNDNVKTGVLISFTMLGCFFSGMMGITMKYMVDKNIPILNQLNPASMITDGFYSLYYYSTLNRYFFNVGSLVVFALLMICISFFSLRRQKYDSI